MSSDAERLKALQSELEIVLEENVTRLLTTVKAAQMVSASIASTQSDIRRHEALQKSLESDLEALERSENALSSDNQKLKKKAESLKDAVRKLRKQRAELVGQVKGLAAEAKSASKG